MQIIKSETDFFTSVEKAFDEIDSRWREYDGLVIAGSHTPNLIQEKIKAIREAREGGTPFLGICFGMQLAMIEFATNVLGIRDATSEELGKGTYIIIKLPGIRVGIYPVENLNGKTSYESHWHNFRINPSFRPIIENKFETSWSINLTNSPEIIEEILEIAKLKDHPYFLVTQFHPEYQSSKDSPHPLLVEFLKICKKNTKKHSVDILKV